MRLLRLVSCLAFAVSMAASLPALAAPPIHTSASSALASIQKSGTLRVGVAQNAPWVLKDKDGQWIGMDIDLARQLAQDMRWKIVFVPTTWGSAIDDLRAGHFDLLAAGLSVTPQRALSLKYSDPYGSFALGLIANKHTLSKDDLLTLESGSKYKIGVLAGTVTAATTKEYLGNSQVIEISDESAAVKDVRDGKLDGMLAEQPLPDALAHSYPDQLRTLDVSNYGKTAHAFAVRRGDQDLLDVVNAWLVYEDAAGWIKSREQFWLHSNAWVELM